MTTVQETTIAQNAAIISLLKDLLLSKMATPSERSVELIAIANSAASGWLEQLEKQE